MRSEASASTISQQSPASLHDCLYRLGRVMEYLDSSEELLKTVLEECKGLLNCEAASVALYDPERDDLVFTVASGGAESFLERYRVPVGSGIIGQVAATTLPMISNDPEADPRWLRSVSEESGFPTRNLAAVPMVYREELIGVLEVLNRQNDCGFDGQDIVLLQIFADQVAVAIQTQRLIQAKKESDRLATFGVAVADVAHTIKNKLFLLDFPVKLIDKLLGPAPNPDLVRSWEVMKRGVGEVKSLIFQMLEYSKPCQLDLTEVDVPALCREMLEGARANPKAVGVEIELIGDSRPLVWTLDARALRSALENLLENSISAVRQVGGSRVAIAIETEEQPRRLLVSVQDDGAGIPPEIQERIFDPFFTTKGSKGTGLGLANVKKAVEAHEGEVLLNSAPGLGTTLTLVFPWK